MPLSRSLVPLVIASKYIIHPQLEIRNNKIYACSIVTFLCWRDPHLTDVVGFYQKSHDDSHIIQVPNNAKMLGTGSKQATSIPGSQIYILRPDADQFPVYSLPLTRSNVQLSNGRLLHGPTHSRSPRHQRNCPGLRPAARAEPDTIFRSSRLLGGQNEDEAQFRAKCG